MTRTFGVSDVTHRQSAEFFDAQFRRQVQDREYGLNPFETLTMEYLKGEVLDLGSGLGNLSLEAGRRGHRVVAVDASPTAVERINMDARREGPFRSRRFRWALRTGASTACTIRSWPLAC
jgi:2-polyprenyl-3-methyl-5-hydroxy-6-metoxy-1,4-benzoquinol methylase